MTPLNLQFSAANENVSVTHSTLIRCCNSPSSEIDPWRFA